MYALFNKDKVFIGFSEEIPHKSIIAKEIPSEQSNLTEWRWQGDYDTGKMVSLSVGYPVEELELEKMLFKHILEKYPVPMQLFHIMNQLKKIVDNNDSLADDSFIDMHNCIKNAVDKHNKRVNYYKNNLNIITKHESNQKYFKN